MIKFCLLTRWSNVNPSAPSLSVVSRLGETISYLSKQRSHSYEYVNEESEIIRRHIDNCDILVLNKHFTDLGLSLCKYAKDAGKLIVYDIDDWIFEYPEYSNGRKDPSALQQQKQRIIDYLNISDLVTVATPYLESLLTKLGVNCSVVPNAIWNEKSEIKEKHSSPQPGSVDSSSVNVLLANADKLKLPNPRLFYGALRTFFEKHPNARMTYIGDHSIDFSFLPRLITAERMPYEAFMAHICESNYDFALVPLADASDEQHRNFNLSKSPFKYLNFGCAKIPAIYSKGTIYDNIITNGKNGMLVENTEEAWCNGMELYLKDSQLRQIIAQSSNLDVANNFHISRSAETLEDLLIQLEQQRPRMTESESGKSVHGGAWPTRLALASKGR